MMENSKPKGVATEAGEEAEEEEAHKIVTNPKVVTISRASALRGPRGTSPACQLPIL